MSEHLPESLFERIYARAPTAADRERLVRVQSALELSEKDEFWPLLMTLDHYAAQNETARQDIVRVVEQLPKVARRTTEEIAATTYDQSKNSIQQLNRHAVAAITSTAQVEIRKALKQQPTVDRAIAWISGLITALALIGATASLTYVYLRNTDKLCSDVTFQADFGDQLVESCVIL